MSADHEIDRLLGVIDAAHGLICNAHQKRVDDVTAGDGASPGWAEAARRWIDAYPPMIAPEPDRSAVASAWSGGVRARSSSAQLNGDFVGSNTLTRRNDERPPAAPRPPRQAATGVDKERSGEA